MTGSLFSSICGYNRIAPRCPSTLVLVPFHPRPFLSLVPSHTHIACARTNVHTQASGFAPCTSGPRNLRCAPSHNNPLCNAREEEEQRDTGILPDAATSDRHSSRHRERNTFSYARATLTASCILCIPLRSSVRQGRRTVVSRAPTVVLQHFHAL